jgi:hypothetical protein
MQAVARRYVARRAGKALAAIAAAEAAAREALRAYAATVALLSQGSDLGASGSDLGASGSDLGASGSDLGASGQNHGGGARAHLRAASRALEQLAALWRDGGEAVAACLPEEAYTRLQVMRRDPFTPVSRSIHTRFTPIYTPLPHPSRGYK